MLEPHLLRNDVPAVAAALARRGYTLDVAKLTALENQRKQLQVETQNLQSERNQLAKQIGIAKAKQEDAAALLQQAGQIATALQGREAELQRLQQELQEFQLTIPNIPHESVPEGTSEQQNKEVRRWSEPPTFTFTPKDHVDLGTQLQGMDFAAAAKIAGARFVVLQNGLAKLQRALIRFMLDIHTQQHGYNEMYVPYLVNKTSLYGTGQLPKFAAEQFHLAGEMEYSLIPTAEVPLTNLVRDVIIPAEQLPLKWVAHTPCFRSEAGSYGKDTRGMIRQHQFEKVEMVQVVAPQDSYAVLEQLTQHAEMILQQLRLPYRVMALCGGDLGFAAAKTYDLEVWLPSQQTYREISSCSNFEAFQARRLQARWRNPDTQKIELVHTLNGSGLAVGRTLVAILENYQDAHGNIEIPEVLVPYMDGLKILSAKRAE